MGFVLSSVFDAEGLIWTNATPHVLITVATVRLAMLSFQNRIRARVAQWIERLPPEQEVAGSTPAAGTSLVLWASPSSVYYLEIAFAEPSICSRADNSLARRYLGTSSPVYRKIF